MLYVIAAMLVLLADQALKYWVTATITLDTGIVELIPGVIHLTNLHNSGAAFGILENYRWFFLAAALVFTLIVIIAVAKKLISGRLGRLMAVIVAAGAIGNGIDRLLYGYVVDMFELEFIRFAVFNVADIFITCGCILFCLYIIFHRSDKASAYDDEDEAVFPDDDVVEEVHIPAPADDYVPGNKTSLFQTQPEPEIYSEPEPEPEPVQAKAGKEPEPEIKNEAEDKDEQSQEEDSEDEFSLSRILSEFSDK